MAARFNPPPNWPAPPPGWTPPPGWRPDPTWGPPPHGWQLWVNDHLHIPVQALPQQGIPPGHHQQAWYTRWWAITGAVVLGLFLIAGVSYQLSTEPPQPIAAGASGTQDALGSDPSPSPSTSAPAPAPPPSAIAPAPAPTPAPSTQAPPPPPPEPDLTPGQENALRSAGQYLAYTSFSRTGLIEQLEYEGYSTEDATWAVDQLGVDWNQQAASKAADYLDYTSFSRQGLVDQLVYEGFTAAEAEYGASQAYDG